MNSETIGTIAKALSAAQGAMKPADMDSKGNFGKYASLASLWDSCRTALAANGLAVVQQTDMHDGEIVLVTKLIHESGEWMGSILPVKPVQATPQGMGSALTYARRYSLSALVGLSADDDDDGTTASVTQRPAQPRPQPAQRPAVQPTPPLPAVSLDEGDGEPDDNPFLDTPASGNGAPLPLISEKQLKMLHALGVQVYGEKNWATKRPQLVEAVTAGERHSAADLTMAEAKKLIDGLLKRQTEMTAKMQQAPTATELAGVPELAH